MEDTIPIEKKVERHGGTLIIKITKYDREQYGIKEGDIVPVDLENSYDPNSKKRKRIAKCKKGKKK